MDRKSWLWRRKSSEKSPGETESTGSLSSHSERFSDDQAYASHSTQSPEVTSKAALNDEDTTETVKTLSDKLSAALLSVSAKEDLVKQHAKVAEEAVSGWENAENEVVALKQKLETANQKNSALEDRLGHLDGALKECVRQLRQAREEQEQKIREVVSKKTHEWESLKSVLEDQLVELQVQLQSVKKQTDSSFDSDLQQKLEAAEKENSTLKLEILSQAKEIKIRIIERDLSTKAAETASKQYLESIKKVAKLEADCRRLKAIARKVSQTNDQKYASSVYAESLTDSQSDCGERLLTLEYGSHKMSSFEPNESDSSQSGLRGSSFVTEHQNENEKNHERNKMVPSVDINFMDDFLEMEKLAALPVIESGSRCVEAGPMLDQPNGGESLKADLEVMVQKTIKLEENLRKIVEEKEELEKALSACKKHLETSQSQLVETAMDLQELQIKMVLATESKKAAEEEVKASQAKRELAESRLRVVENEVNTLLLKAASLEEEVQNERLLSADKIAKCQKLEDELFKLKHEAEDQREAEFQRTKNDSLNLKIKQENELALAADKFAECQKTIASLGQHLKSLASLEDFLLDSENLHPTIVVDNIQSYESGNEAHNLRSTNLCLSGRDAAFSEAAANKWSYSSNKKSERNSSLSLDPDIHSEKNQNGFGKLFPKSKN
ncbi:filament-like plant protein 3 [Cannabis sativa]|uniref:filament-like plant protein 3 n=1 Tax=Cannabis sativa TaxID=3483 RepID=UPI0029CA4ABC|nr:filament-like plant protein 3 [Cannabis sativa]XP_030497316.2 filament-like plant protein 3 [Cannabis sativa]XP_060970199.1 filament-like plant protein 3 [Cannabis sativa]